MFFLTKNNEIVFLHPNKMKNTNTFIFWCLFMILPFLGLIM